jgi:hypothetical protein
MKSPHRSLLVSARIESAPANTFLAKPPCPTRPANCQTVSSLIVSASIENKKRKPVKADTAPLFATSEPIKLTRQLQWYAESVDSLAAAVHPRLRSRRGLRDPQFCRRRRLGGCWPDFSHEPQCSMAREPTKLQPSRTVRKSVSVYLSPEKWRKVKVLAAATDTTVNALMRRAVDLVLAEHKGKPPKRRGQRVGYSTRTGPHPAAARPPSPASGRG